MTLSGGGAPHSVWSSVVWASLTRVASYPLARAPCSVERTHQSVCAPTTTSRPTAEAGQHGLERGVLEGVAVVLLDQRLCVARSQLGDDLPGVAPSCKLLVGVLHPDHGHPLPPRPLDKAADIRDDRVALVSPLEGGVLHVDDQECSVRPVLKRGHGLPSSVVLEDRTTGNPSARRSQSWLKLSTRATSPSRSSATSAAPHPSAKSDAVGFNPLSPDAQTEDCGGGYCDHLGHERPRHRTRSRSDFGSRRRRQPQPPRQRAHSSNPDAATSAREPVGTEEPLVIASMLLEICSRIASVGRTLAIR